MTNTELNTAANVAEQGAPVAPDNVSSKKGTTRKKNAPKGRKTAKVGKPGARRKVGKAPRTKTAALPRTESKTAKILALLRRPKGATLAELAKLTGWQKHSIRGFLSGAVGKKMGLKLQSARREDGERVYSIKR